MENRRNFLKGAGILGAFLAGTITYENMKAPAKEDISGLAPESDSKHNTLILSGGYEKSRESTLFGSSINPKNSVAMTVGKDNRLWIQVGGEWKRLALEA
jgi:hypothetical protein